MDKAIAVHSYLKTSLSWGVVTNKGKVREQNEDSFIIEPEEGIFIVADGMGGHRGGKLASTITTEDLSVLIETALHRLRSDNPRSIKRILTENILEQNRQLSMEAESESGQKEMGTTVAVTIIRDARAYIANLGDSRIYRFRNNKIKQVSKDHSVVSELLRKGKINEDQAENHEARGQITHYIGMEERADPHIRSFALKKNDRLLLCTDGLTDMLNDNKINKIQKTATDPQFACQKLVKAANNAGGHDNITVIIIDWQRG